VNEQERKELVGKIAAEFDVKMDANDPALIIVAMCDRVLQQRMSQLSGRGPSPALTAEAMAQAVSSTYATQVLPKLQAVVNTEVRRAIEAVRPTSVWTHPAVIGPTCMLIGVIVGFLLRRIA
jgi:hypothetical protein